MNTKGFSHTSNETSLQVDSKESVEELEKSEKNFQFEIEEEKPSEVSEVIKNINKLYHMVGEILLETSWFETDGRMTTDFMKDLLFDSFILPLQSTVLQNLSKDSNHIDEIKKNLKPYIEGLSKEDISGLMFSHQNEQVGFMLKHEKLFEKNGRYPYVSMPRGDFNNEKNISNIIESISYFIEKYKIKEVGVNLFNGSDTAVMMAVSDYLKEKGISIHVLGLCGMTCSNYLLLSAESVSIGSYGVIAYNNNLSSIYKEILETSEIYREQYQKNLEETGGIEKSIAKYLGNSKNRIQLEEYLIQEESHSSILFKMKDRLERNKGQFNSSFIFNDAFLLSKNERKIFDNLLYDSFHSEINPNLASINEQERLLSVFLDLTEKEKIFFDKHSLKSHLSYSFFDLLDVTTYLTQTRSMKHLYPDHKRKYKNIKTEDYPHHIVPSVSLLKSLGLNIVKGSNHSSKMYNKNVLSLDLNEAQIEECGFFEKDRDFSEVEKCFINLIEKAKSLKEERPDASAKPTKKSPSKTGARHRYKSPENAKTKEEADIKIIEEETATEKEENADEPADKSAEPAEKAQTELSAPQDEESKVKDSQNNPVSNPIDVDGVTDQKPDVAQSPILRSVTCSNRDGKSIVYNLRGPTSLYVCTLDVSNTPAKIDWNAKYNREYCAEKLDEQVALKTDEDWICS